MNGAMTGSMFGTHQFNPEQAQPPPGYNCHNGVNQAIGSAMAATPRETTLLRNARGSAGRQRGRGGVAGGQAAAQEAQAQAHAADVPPLEGDSVAPFVAPVVDAHVAVAPVVAPVADARVASAEAGIAGSTMS